jgi:hypothetical protein
MKQETKHRGGQQGNRNAVKHGYYSRELNKEEKLDFNIAAGMQGIDQEIALLRFKIKKAVTSGDVADLIPLSKITYALEKLIRTHQKFFVLEDSKYEHFRKALEKIEREIGGRSSSDVSNSFIANPQIQSLPLSPVANNEKTIDPQNKAGST